MNATQMFAFAVTPLSFFSSGQRTSQEGTGFFFENEGQTFLITNKHLVYDEIDGTPPDEVRFRVKTAADDLTKATDRSLSLRGGRLGWIRHIEPSTIDIVALEIPPAALEACEYRCFSISDLPPADLLLHSGEDALIAGYPLGHYDEVNNFPLVRRGSIATLYGAPFKGRPYFEIDGRLHPGTSGAPVLLKPTNIVHRASAPFSLFSQPVSYLLGIHSEGLDVAEGESFDVNRVWYASLIRDITMWPKGVPRLNG